MEADVRSISERLEAFKLVKWLMDVGVSQCSTYRTTFTPFSLQLSVSHLKRPIVQSLVAIANSESDVLAPTSLVLLREATRVAVGAITVSPSPRYDEGTSPIEIGSTVHAETPDVHVEVSEEEVTRVEAERILALLARCGAIAALQDSILRSSVPLVRLLHGAVVRPRVHLK